MSEWSLHHQLAADTEFVAGLPVCDVRLMNDANYPWLILVPRVADARELIDLDDTVRHQLTDEIDTASRALRTTYRPHKLNVAALGNVVAQLHVHVIARFEHDPAWPAPVWGRVPARPHAPDELAERLARLRDALRR